MKEPAPHEAIPEPLREEIVWRLRQGGMAELFRVGTMQCINAIFMAGVQAGARGEAIARMAATEDQVRGELSVLDLNPHVRQALAAGLVRL
jgi:hypothetical protein